MFDPLAPALGAIALAMAFWLLVPPRRAGAAAVADRTVVRWHSRPGMARPASPQPASPWLVHRVARQRGAAGTDAPDPSSAAPGIEIARATPDDVPAIQRIAGQWHVGGRAGKDLTERGFLVSDFSVDDYQHLVAASDHCFVARRDGEVVGFVLAYSDTALNRVDDTTADWISTRLDDFVVIKQVAVAPEHTGAGIGRALYLFLISTIERGSRLVAAVVDEPLNVRSREFHRGLGFTEAFSLEHDDQRTRSIWIYQTTHASDELLNAQYEAAVQLYMHEDTRNWDKLRNYLYVTITTAAALGFVLGQTPGQAVDYSPAVVGLGICAIGLMTSVGFAITLRSGVNYLAVRKQAVAELEDAYIGRDGVRVVSRHVRTKTWLRRSPTTWVLQLVPVGGLGLWLLALLYLGASQLR